MPLATMAASSDNPILYYEQPITKPARLFLRFEQLVQRFSVGANGNSSTESHIALLALLDLYQHGMHVDLKAEVLREIERLLASPQEGLPGDTKEEIRTTLEDGITATNQIHGQLGAKLKNHHFFNLIRQRMTMGGGVNSFDLPIYHLWTSKPAEERRVLLQDWAKPYLELNNVISSLLSTMRGHCSIEHHTAQQGFFQQVIPIENSCRLLRIGLPAGTQLYPEVSSGRQRFSVRFFEPADLSERPSQTKSNVDFEIMYCGL